MNVSRSVARYVRAQLDLSYGFRGRDFGAGLRVFLTMPSYRSTTGAALRGAGEPVLSQELSGAVSFDRAANRLSLTRQSWVGRSAATIRFFVDHDGDGARDSEEPLIEGARVSFRRPVSMKIVDDHSIVAYNLFPYERYSVEVDERSVQNPLWIPRATEFSFITDPNQHKVVDVPFYVSGEVSGTVLMDRGGTLQPISGLRVVVREAKGSETWDLPVFSDGSFYKLGLPPGDYVAHVDSSQLEVLGAKSDPAHRTFSLATTEMGDYVDGLEFTLRGSKLPPTDLPQEETAPVVGTEAPEPARTGAPEAAVADGTSDSGDTLYTVGRDDISLMEVARQVYGGDASLWPKIWVANRDQIPDPDLILPGQQLRIPAPQPLDAEEVGARNRYFDPLQGESIYVVRSKDRGLMDVARRVYDEAGLWPKIWYANRDLLAHPDSVRVGQRLKVPVKAPLTEEESRSVAAGR